MIYIYIYILFLALHCDENVLDASAEQTLDEVDGVNANMPTQLKNKASSNSLINKQGNAHNSIYFSYHFPFI